MNIEPTPEQRRQLGATGAAIGLGCAIVVTLVGFIAGGAALDRLLGTGPILTLIGIALGLAGAGYQLYELSRVGRKDRPPGPLGQRFADVSAKRTGAKTSGPARDLTEDARMDEEE